MFDLFGSEMPLAVRFFLAFLIVLGLIGAAAWAVRRFGSARLGGAVRGRQPRLAVIDYASIDARRRLILVRRDNVEHLVMIGGPTDVVVESNIVRAVAASSREPAIPRSPAPAEPLPPTLPLPEAALNDSWPLQPEPPAPPRRAPRIDAFPEEHGGVPPLHTEPSPRPQHAETPPRSQRDTLNALAEDIASHPVPPPPPVNPIPPRLRPAVPPRPQPAEPRAQVRIEPRPPRHQAPPVASEPSAADQSLAEMAQRLEAALRKPKAAAPAPAPEEFDEVEPAAPPLPLPSRAARAAPPEAKPARAEPNAREVAKEGRALYDTLEQEMASLLGRPAGKT
jgi:flagellar biogenesis protein FliO